MFVCNKHKYRACMILGNNIAGIDNTNVCRLSVRWGLIYGGVMVGCGEGAY
jgi:hypothetical protein